MVSGAPAILLSSMATEAVCERVRQIDGIDQSMMGQYAATIRKVSRMASDTDCHARLSLSTPDSDNSFVSRRT